MWKEQFNHYCPAEYKDNIKQAYGGINNENDIIDDNVLQVEVLEGIEGK